MTGKERCLPLNDYMEAIDSFDGACRNFEHDTIKELLLEASIDFNPTDNIGNVV